MNVTTEFKDTTDPLTVDGNVNIKVEKVQKDFFQVQVLDFMIGIFERSQIRQLIGDFDAQCFTEGNFKVVINGFILGIFNQLQIREMVSSFDNAID